MDRLIGHRGASAYAPENTIAAFQKAYELGCRFVEFDVMLSQDGEPFVIHDTSLKRTTNGRGDVGQVSAEYLHSLDAGSWFSSAFAGEKIPTLQAVIQWLTAFGMHANIEIKPYPKCMEQTTLAVLMHINRYWPSDKKPPLVSSFDREALALCRHLAPELPLGFLLDKWENDWLKKAQEIQCFSVHLSGRIATEKRIAAISKEGYQVYVYTIDRKRQAFKLLNWGANALFSNYPDLLQ